MATSMLLLHSFFFSLLLIILAPVHGQCLKDQKTLLLELKRQLIFNSSESLYLVGWNHTKDCCRWDGVECDGVGHVIGLDLYGEAISGGIEESSSLFGLSYLQKLSLAGNEFNNTQIPREIQGFIHLTHLDLSNAGFSGTIPSTLGNLTKLLHLDLSQNFFTGLIPSFNMSKKISTIDLSYNSLIGSLSCLHFEALSNLVDLALDSNSLSRSIPHSLFALPSLRSLSLSANHFDGPINEQPHVMNISNIVSLDLSNNSFGGSISFFVCGMPLLQYLSLSNNHFSGKMNGSPCVNLSNVYFLDLSHNALGGSIPLFLFGLPSLHSLSLSSNQFSGQVNEFSFVNFSNVYFLDLSENALDGSIPLFLFGLPSLQSLSLSSNQFSGQINEFPIVNISNLQDLDLSNNSLSGRIPNSLFHLPSLTSLQLSHNHFTEFSIVNISSLVDLDLSDNSLSGRIPISLFHLPSLTSLQLSHNQFSEFPNSDISYSFLDLIRQSPLEYLDLSDNRIVGEIPSWIWEIGNGTLYQLQLDCNLLTDLQKPYHIPTSLEKLDLHSNLLRGELPLTPSAYVDFSDNKFDNSIPPEFANFTRYFVSLANNSLSGEIPISLCNALDLHLLDLSFNNLGGPIPHCLFENLPELGVLNLESNNISGDIPDTFPDDCSLHTLDLSDNNLGGRIPKSLGLCKHLHVMSVGSNNIDDSFPCMLSPSLRLLVLRSNRFHGEIKCYRSWPNLQIIDIASNNFSGSLDSVNFSSWGGMIRESESESDAPLKKGHLAYVGRYYLPNSTYVDEVTLIVKGIEQKFSKIRVDFTAIDFSCNNFHGEIPDAIGDLRLLYLLNLSHNSLTGTIPKSSSNMMQLGSLDLSMNQLVGAIPEELARLTFLSVLNLSYNKLVGMIPSGHQFQTFAADSFQGNLGLCGFPLNISCKTSDDNNDLSPPEGEDGREIEWEYVSAAVGYVVGLGSIAWLLLLCRSFREKCFDKVEEVVEEIVVGRNRRRKQARRRVVRRQ